MAAYKKAGGRDYLTPTEIQVLEALAAGDSPQQIASARYVALSTVRYHIWNAYEVLGVGAAIPAINEARRRGLIR